MANKTIIWLAVIVILVALIILVIAIIVIHSTKDNPKRLELGLIWLYIGTILVFFAGLMVAIAAELTTNICQLPYSGKYIPTDKLSGIQPNVISYQ